MKARFRVMCTTAGYRIYDYKLFDIIKVKGKWYLTKIMDEADTLCESLNGLEEGV